jgi:hypothetical protein
MSEDFNLFLTWYHVFLFVIYSQCEMMQECIFHMSLQNVQTARGLFVHLQSER